MAIFDSGIVHIDIPENVLRDPILEIPAGIAIEGGTARSIARRLITGEIEKIRDLDLVCVEGDYTNEELDKIAWKFCEDRQKGCHLRRTSLEEYFQTRDFTINEVLVVGKTLLATKEAVIAYSENKIVVCNNERITSRTACKAQYLKAVFECETGHIHTVDSRIEKRPGHLRDIAVFLDKAMSRGMSVAKGYAKNIIGAGIMMFRDEDPREMALYCAQHGCRFMLKYLEEP